MCSSERFKSISSLYVFIFNYTLNNNWSYPDKKFEIRKKENFFDEHRRNRSNCENFFLYDELGENTF